MQSSHSLKPARSKTAGVHLVHFLLSIFKTPQKTHISGECKCNQIYFARQLSCLYEVFITAFIVTFSIVAKKQCLGEDMACNVLQFDCTLCMLYFQCSAFQLEPTVFFCDFPFILESVSTCSLTFVCLAGFVQSCTYFL